MDIIGRLTADSTVKTIGENKTVVNFSIAMNDTYKPKDGEKREITTYVDCAYWRDAKRAEWLKKGAMVQLTGRIGLNAYLDREGNAVARLTFHVNDINILVFAKREEQPQEAVKKQGFIPDVSQLPKDDLPF